MEVADDDARFLYLSAAKSALSSTIAVQTIVARKFGRCTACRGPPSVLFLRRVFGAFVLEQEARLMPSENRRQFMYRKVKHEYAQCRGETNQERIRFLLQFAEVSVDNAR